MRVTILQLNSQDDVEANLLVAERLIRCSHSQFEADLYVLPEYAPFGGGDAAQKLAAAETIPTGAASMRFARLAAELRTTIHAGTLNEAAGGAKMFNTSVVFGPDGREVCRYRKICLFEGKLPDGRTIRETTIYRPGEDVVLFDLGGIRFGCAVCYDLRFPEVYRELRRRGADVVIFVAAMSRGHGQAHLEVLLRARAIENQVYIVAAEQCGTYANGTKANYGNSMLVDPWGSVVARLGDEVGVLHCELDMELLQSVRSHLPVLQVAEDLERVLASDRARLRDLRVAI